MNTPPRRSHAWTFAFIAALLCVAGALAFLVYAAFDRFGDGERDAAPAGGGAGDTPSAPTPTATVPPEQRPRVWLDPALGVLPESTAFASTASRAEADLVVAPAVSPNGVITSYLIPVASFDAGVDSLTLDQIRAIFAGEVTDWTELGGRPGPVTPVLAIDVEAVLAPVLGLRETGIHGRYNDTREAAAELQLGRGVITFVPLNEVRADIMAIAVDGADPVRGRGNLDAWPFAQRVSVTAMTDTGEAIGATVLAAVTAEVPVVTTVVATGDTIPVRCSLAQIEASGDWGSPFRGAMADYLSSADLTLGSLDTSLSDVAVPYRCVETTNIASRPEAIEMLTLGGFDVVTVATNHVFDCGEVFCGNEAFLQTLERLSAAGIQHVGGGVNLDAALAPAFFEANGTTFAVLGFDDVAAMDLGATADAPGTAPLDDDYSEERAAGEPAFFRPAEELSLTRFTAAIQSARQQADVVIVLVQSGTEDTHTPSPRSLKALRAAEAAGADLIIGNQAHHVQAVELRPDAFIAYALGNFVYDQVHTPEHYQCYVVEAAFWGPRLANVRLLPCQIEEQHRPVFVDAELRAKILDDVFTATAALPPLE